MQAYGGRREGDAPAPERRRANWTRPLKEALGGFYMIDVPDLDAALEWASRMPNITYGTVEVRPVQTFD